MTITSLQTQITLLVLEKNYRPRNMALNHMRKQDLVIFRMKQQVRGPIQLLDPIQENNEGALKLPLINSTPNKFEALADLDEDGLDTRSDPGVEVDHISTNFYTSDNEILNDKLITSRKPRKKQAPPTDRQTRSSAKTASLSSH